MNPKFQTASEIERAASSNMYKEQAWVEKLLKRMRNEADVQSQVPAMRGAQLIIED